MKHILLTNMILHKFTLFAFIIFLKCIFFHFFCFHYIAISSIWNAPIDFFAFYFAKMLPAIFIASFLFLTKKHKWTIIILLLIDIWLFCNILYFRAYGYFINIHVIKTIVNIHGVEDSIFTYFKPIYVIIFALSILWIPWGIKSNQHDNRDIKKFSVCMYVCIVFLFYDWYWGASEKYSDDNYNCFKLVNKYNNGTNTKGGLVSKFWFEAQSPLHFFPQVFYELAMSPFTSRNTGLSDEDIEKIKKHCLPKQTIMPKQNLLIILWESLESWTLTFTDTNGNKILPNLNSFLNQKNILYVEKIKSQAKRGMSGDGQLIINTGLLPMEDVIVCELYGNNTFPNLANLYPYSSIINPLQGCWNQDVVTKSYGYKTLKEPAGNNKATDKIIFNATLQEIQSQKQPFCIMALTISTHTPFNSNNMSPISLPEDCPKNLSDYLTCCHYADSCIGFFLNEIKKDSLLSHTTIVITGDHKIFQTSLLQEFQPFAKKHGYKIPEEQTYCPLIIFSPNIKSKNIEEECYQMDIFPTILHCINADNYYWQGFGVNLLNDSIRKKRTTEEDAYYISDKIHRSNYFKIFP